MRKSWLFTEELSKPTPMPLSSEDHEENCFKITVNSSEPIDFENIEGYTSYCEKAGIYMVTENEKLQNCKLSLEKFMEKSKGIYMFAEMKGLQKPIPMLLDTGASVNILSYQLYESIPDAEKPKLSSTDCRILNASGSNMNIAGKITMPFYINDGREEIDFYVTDLPKESIILSFRWLTRYSACDQQSKYPRIIIRK